MKRIVTMTLMAFAFTGCIGEADEPPIVIECFDFEGQEICGEVLWPAAMEFPWTVDEIGGKTVRFGEHDSARYLLPQTVEIVASDRTGRSTAIVERGPVDSLMCFDDGVFIDDPQTGLSTKIIDIGECRVLSFSYDLRDAVWE